MTEARPGVRTERTGSVLVVTLNRPQACNADLAGRVADALEQEAADTGIRVVLTGGYRAPRSLVDRERRIGRLSR